MTYKAKIPGVVLITGPHDTGKTTFALECGAHPERILFVDDDLKGQGTVHQLMNDGLEFGYYENFAANTRGKTLLQTYQYGTGLISHIEAGRFDAIIWDTWTRFGTSFKSYVNANPGAFRGSKDWAARGDMKGGQQWAEAKIAEAQTLAELSQLAPSVFIIAHLKDAYVQNVASGQQLPAVSKTHNRVHTMSLWLQHCVYTAVPYGLLLKRPNRKMMTDNGLRTENLLPRKLMPRSEDTSLWDAIDRFLKKPMGRRAPTADETPNEVELAVLNQALTVGQQHTLKLKLEIQAAELGLLDREDEVAQETATIDARRLKAEGKSNKAIAEALDVSVRDVKDLLDGAK